MESRTWDADATKNLSCWFALAAGETEGAADADEVPEKNRLEAISLRVVAAEVDACEHALFSSTSALLSTLYPNVTCKENVVVVPDEGMAERRTAVVRHARERLGRWPPVALLT